MKKILAMSSLLVSTSVWAAAPGSGSLDPSTLVNPNIRPATVPQQPPVTITTQPVVTPETVRPSAVSSQTRKPLEELSYQIKTLLVNSKAQPFTVNVTFKPRVLAPFLKISQPRTLSAKITPEFLTSLLAIVDTKPAASGQTTDDNFGVFLPDHYAELQEKLSLEPFFGNASIDGYMGISGYVVESWKTWSGYAGELLTYITENNKITLGVVSDSLAKFNTRCEQLRLIVRQQIEYQRKDPNNLNYEGQISYIDHEYLSNLMHTIQNPLCARREINGHATLPGFTPHHG